MFRKNSHGNVYLLALALGFILILLGMFFFNVILGTGGKRQITDAVNAGSLNMAKAAVNQIGVPLNNTLLNTNFSYYANGGLVNLSGYNQAVGQATLVAINAGQEGTQSAFNNAQSLVNVLQGTQGTSSLGYKLTQLLSKPTQADSLNHSMQGSFMSAATTNPINMSSKLAVSTNFLSNDYQAGYVSGADMNVSANTQMFPLLSTYLDTQNPDPVTQGNYFLNAYKPIKIQVGNYGTLSIMGVALNPRQTPYLTSPNQVSSTSPLSAAGNASAIPPNAFVAAMSAQDSQGNKDSSQVAVVAGAMNATNSNVFPLSIPNGYIEVINPEGLPQGNSQIANPEESVLNNELMEGIYTANNNVFSTNPALIDAWVQYNTGSSGGPTSSLPSKHSRIASVKQKNTLAKQDTMSMIWNCLIGAAQAQSSSNGGPPTLQGLYNSDGSPLSLTNALQITNRSSVVCTCTNSTTPGNSNCEGLMNSFAAAYNNTTQTNLITDPMTALNGAKIQVWQIYAKYDAAIIGTSTPYAPHAMTNPAANITDSISGQHATGMEAFTYSLPYITDYNGSIIHQPDTNAPDSSNSNGLASAGSNTFQSGGAKFTTPGTLGKYLSMIDQNVPPNVAATLPPGITSPFRKSKPVEIAWSKWPSPLNFIGQLVESTINAFIPPVTAQQSSTTESASAVVASRLQQRMQQIYPGLTNTQFSYFMNNVVNASSNTMPLGTTYFIYQNHSSKTPNNQNPTGNFIYTQTPPSFVTASSPVPAPDGPPAPSTSPTNLSTASTQYGQSLTMGAGWNYDVLNYTVNPPGELGAHSSLFISTYGAQGVGSQPAMKGQDSATWIPSSGYNNLLGVLNMNNSVTGTCTNCTVMYWPN